MDDGTELEEILPTEDQLQLYLWQRACFHDTCHGPREKADSLRLQLAQLSYYRKKKVEDGEGVGHLDDLSENMLEQYGCVMDDKEEGLQNYSAVVTTLASGQENDVQSWKPALSLEAVRNFPEFNVLLKSEKEKSIPFLKRYSPFCHPLVKQPSMTSGHQPSPSIQVSCDPINSTSLSHSSVSHDQSGDTRSTNCQKQNLVFSSSPQTKLCQTRRSKRARRDDCEVGSKDNQREDVEVGSKDNQREQQAFITARDQYHINQQKKYGGSGQSSANYNTSKRSLGTRRGAGSKFVPPVKQEDGSSFEHHVTSKVMSHGGPSSKGGQLPPELEGNERLKNTEPRMVELILNEIMDVSHSVQWDDIAGLQYAKESIKEIVVWPMMRPDLFTGLRGPPKGILLFGPPGTGKTLIGKCIASQVQATFFSISASSLTSKWIGEGEKMVRALFAVARCYQPAVVFIDEIDSLLSQRSDTEHESSRRIKTEFLVQLDGATTCSEDRLLVIGATNRPQEIDEAARRRLVKRLYIPLPDEIARMQIIRNLMRQQSCSLSDSDIELVAKKADGYSGADMTNLCREAAYGPVREAAGSLQHITAEEMRPVIVSDFDAALNTVKASVSEKDLDLYLDWNKKFGCGK